jgi:hypothetical protein
MYQNRSWCCTYCNGSTRMFQVFYLSRTYVTNVSSECFKSRSGVEGRHPLTAAKGAAMVSMLVPDIGRRLCRQGKVGTGSQFRHASAGWALGAVPPCERGMDAGRGFAVLARDWRGTWFRTLALDGNGMGVREM